MVTTIVREKITALAIPPAEAMAVTTIAREEATALEIPLAEAMA